MADVGSDVSSSVSSSQSTGLAPLYSFLCLFLSIPLVAVLNLMYYLKLHETACVPDMCDLQTLPCFIAVREPDGA